jgi:hypothetical protein
MNIKIEIDCDDHNELFAHLTVIRQQLKKELKKNPDFTGELEDSNCYGYHSIDVQDNEHVGQYLIIQKP